MGTEDKSTGFESMFKLFVLLCVVGFSAVVISSVYKATELLDKNFPGFLIYENSVVCEVSLPHWTGRDSGHINSYDTIVGIEGTELTATEIYQNVGAMTVGSLVNYDVLKQGQVTSLSVRSMRFGFGDFIQVFGGVYIVGFLVFITGLVVYFLKPRLRSSKFFFFFCLSVSVWFTSIFDAQSTYILGSLPIWGWMLSPAFLIALGLVFPEKNGFLSTNRSVLLIPFIPSVALIISHYLFFDNPVMWQKIDILTWVYVLMSTLTFIGTTVYSYIKPDNLFDKERARIILLGAFVGFFVPALCASIITFLGISHLNNLAFLVIVFPLSIAYAIVKHKLFDIDVIVEKTLTYGLLTGAVGGIFALMVVGFNIAFAKYGGWRNPAFFVVLSGLLVVALNPLKSRIQDIVDLTFFRKKYDYRKTVEEVSYAMTSILSLDKIVEKIITVVETTMFSDPTTVAIYNQDRGTYRVSGRTHEIITYTGKELSEDSVIITLLNKYKKEIFKEDLAADEKFIKHSQELYQVFDEYNASLFVPLFFKRQLIGVICLGGKKSGLAYTSRDIKLLRILANQSAIAIENALAFKLVEDYAKKLESANNELQDTQAQLVQAEKMSAIGQLAAGIAHEIRNPLNIIEGARYYLSTHMTAKNSSPEVDDYLNYIKHEIDRTNRLIDSLLKFSRAEPAQLEPVDVNSILQNILVLIRKQLVDSKVNMNTNLNDKIPVIRADSNQLWQVFINIILNAIQAMPQGGELTIDTGTYHENLSPANEETVFVTIADTGVGIETEDIPKLFDPFFTRKDMGTGLGLSIAYKIIEEHKGKIIVSSEKGKGTVFVIELPVKSGEEGELNHD